MQDVEGKTFFQYPFCVIAPKPSAHMYSLLD